MSARKVSPSYQSHSNSDPEEIVVPATGELLADGTSLEIVRDADSKHLKLLISIDKLRWTEDKYERGGRVYRPPSFSASLRRAIPIPTQAAPYGSTETLFKALCSTFTTRGVPEEAAKLFSYITLASWFPCLLAIAPCLTFSAPRAVAVLVSQLLGCLVWRGLNVVHVTSTAMAAIVEQVHPTLLIDARFLGLDARRLLCASSGPRPYILQRQTAVDFGLSRVIYVGDQPDLELTIDFCPHVHLPPSRAAEILNGLACENIMNEFQPQLLAYRIAHLTAVRTSGFDLANLQAENRIIARMLGACIVDAPAIQAEIGPLLDAGEDQMRRSRLTNRTCVTIEALLAECHDGEQKFVLVKAIAEAASIILRGRGEVVELEPREVGSILDSLELPREARKTNGFRILLTTEVRRHVHRLARDHEVESIHAPRVSCPTCSEILDNNPETPEDKTE